MLASIRNSFDNEFIKHVLFVSVVSRPELAFLWAVVLFLAGSSLCGTLQKQPQIKYFMKAGGHGYQMYTTTQAPYHKAVKKEPNSPCPYKPAKASMQYYPSTPGHYNGLPYYPFRVNNKVYYSTSTASPSRRTSYPTTTETSYRVSSSEASSYPSKTTLAYYSTAAQDYSTTTEYYPNNYPPTSAPSYEPANQGVEYSYRVPAVKYYSASTMAPMYNQEQRYEPQYQEEEAPEYQVPAASYDYPPEDVPEGYYAPEVPVYEAEQPVDNYDDQPYNPTMPYQANQQPMLDSDYSPQYVNPPEMYDSNNPNYGNNVYPVSTPAK